MKNLAHEKLDFSYIADFEDRFPLKYSSTFDWVLHINPTLFYLNNQVLIINRGISRRTVEATSSVDIIRRKCAQGSLI